MRPVVETSSGKLRGREQDGVVSFKGIPFARPPVGALRWLPPESPEPWTGERDATAFGASAMQRALPGGLGDLIGIPSVTPSEDCLTLNVWTPELRAASGGRPVMVWIHGGGNIVGSGSQPRVNGEHLARRGDVVVVTIHYRLGSFGFLHAPELGASGNEALLDQVAALRWVRREIGAFGGDPSCVTVFGQSAGGFDIAQLMALRAAAGCFDRAVPMSGSLVALRPRELAAAATERFVERFGGLEKLRAVPAEEILAYQLELTGDRVGTSLRFGPVLDGEVIREDAAVGIGAGRHTRGMPLMIGHTRDEFALFTAHDPSVAELDDAGLVERGRGLFGPSTERAVEVYRKAREARGESTAPPGVWNAMMTDAMFRIPAIRTAELHTQHTPQTWMYRFDYESPALEGRLGACHSLDIPFIWGTTGVEKMVPFCGKGPAVESLSERMMATYLAFARNGDPANATLPEWPRYDAERRATLRLGPEAEVEDAPQDEERRFWSALRSERAGEGR